MAKNEKQRNEIKIFLCVLLFTASNFHCCHARPVKSHNKAQAENISQNSSKWWEVSAKADKLIDQGKYVEAEKMLNGILSASNS
jgi:hypothetical protein